MSRYWEAHAKWQDNPDASLEEAERRVAACADARGKALYLGDLSLERLPDGVASLTWLTELRALGGRLSDLSLLAPLSDVTLLEIGSLRCPFPGLQFATGWSKLESLWLLTPTSLDLSPLASCSRLRRLSIASSSQEIELSNLRLVPCDALEHVSLDGTQSSDFDRIRDCTRLTFLQLIRTNMTSLEGFERLRHLRALHVRRASVSDISPLRALGALEDLTLAEAPVSDISPLSGLPLLRHLHLANTHVADIAPLEALANTQRAFNTEQTRQRVWSPLGIESLDVGHTPVRDLDLIGHFERLRHLSVDATAVTSLTPLGSCTELSTLDISRTAVSTLGPAGSFAHLRWLTASESHIQDLEALAPAPSLQGIDISKTPVDDLSPLRSASNCRSLNLRGSRVRDLDPILNTGSEESQERGDSRQSLDFRDTPASQVNERLAALAALAEESTERCFRETKAYLRERAGSAPGHAAVRDG